MLLKISAILTITNCIHSANILGFFVSPNVKSDYYYPIFEELALKGHQVTLISPTLKSDLQKVEHLRLENTNFVSKHVENVISENSSAFTNTMNVFDNYRNLITLLLQNGDVKQILMGEYDVVISEHVSPLTFIPSVLSGASSIGFSATGGQIHAHDSVSNPLHPVINPASVLNMEEDLNYHQRLFSCIYNIWYKLYYNFFELLKCDTIIKQHFGDNLPYLGDVEKNVSLQIFYTNPILGYVRPKMANVIEVSLAQTKYKNIQTWLSQFLDGSRQGFVYVNLGNKLDTKFLEFLIQSIYKLPYNVVWNYEYDERMLLSPRKFMVKPNLPQAEILAHKNVKLMITDGDILSVEQAVVNDVTVLALPMNFGQKHNVKVIEQKDIGKVLNWKNLTTKILMNSIMEVGECRKLKTNVKKLGLLLREEPKGVLKAVWWIEYIIRRKGALHIRSTAPNYYLYQYYFLDIFALIFLALIMVFFVIYFVVKFILKAGRMMLKIKVE